MPTILVMLHPLDMQQLLVICMTVVLLAPYAEGCSSRAIPKPRATSTMLPSMTNTRPNISFPILECPATYNAWYCLNDATCFAVEIHNEILYNCECANGFVGPRCEYKEIDGSYFPSRRSAMLRTASIASGVVLAIFMAVLLCWILYVRYGKKNEKEQSERSFNAHENPAMDEVDNITGVDRKLRPFGPHHYPVKTMAEALLEQHKKKYNHNNEHISSYQCN